MSQNFESVDCRRREPPPDFKGGEDWFPKCENVLERPGDFLWLRNAVGEITDLLIFLPGNEGGSIAPVPVVRHVKTDRAWLWDGDKNRPTLTPSIWRNKPFLRDGVLVDTRNNWHGNLNGGRLESDVKR